MPLVKRRARVGHPTGACRHRRRRARLRRKGQPHSEGDLSRARGCGCSPSGATEVSRPPMAPPGREAQLEPGGHTRRNLPMDVGGRPPAIYLKAVESSSTDVMPKIRKDLGICVSSAAMKLRDNEQVVAGHLRVRDMKNHAMPLPPLLSQWPCSSCASPPLDPPAHRHRTSIRREGTAMKAFAIIARDTQPAVQDLPTPEPSRAARSSSRSRPPRSTASTSPSLPATSGHDPRASGLLRAAGRPPTS